MTGQTIFIDGGADVVLRGGEDRRLALAASSACRTARTQGLRQERSGWGATTFPTAW
jgi:hypothetical protein